MNEINPRIILSNRIDIWMKQHGYTSADVGKLFKLSPTAINHWKNGKALPTFFSLIKLGKLGVDISGIDGLPSAEFSPSRINDFCDKNNISKVELSFTAGVNFHTINRFTKNGDCKAVESLCKLEKFIEEYESSGIKEDKQEECVEKEVQEMQEFIEDIVKEEQREEDTTVTDEGCVPLSELPNSEPIKVITGLNAPAPRNYYKKVTLRELLGFGEKFNIMDAEIITDGGFEVFGFKLVIEEDGVPHLALKTR